MTPIEKDVSHFPMSPFMKELVPKKQSENVTELNDFSLEGNKTCIHKKNETTFNKFRLQLHSAQDGDLLEDII